MTTFGTLSIDEVHPLIDCTFGREPEYENRSAMYLKRVPPQSLPQPPPTRITARRTPAGKTPAFHVSLSPDPLFKQPGNHGGSHPSVSRRAVEARASENHRIPIHCSSEELQRRAIAP